MKRLVAFALAAVMAFALCACGGSPSSAAPASGAAADGSTASASASASAEGVSEKTTPEDTFVYATNGEPGNVDPHVNAYLMGQIVTNCLYDTLITRDNKTGEIYPALATAWEFTEDGNLSFTLRDDVYFHNGDKMTAEDVVFSIQRMCTSAASSTFYSFIDGENTKVVDDTHVEVALKYPFAGALNYLANPRGAIVSKAYCETAGDDGMARSPMGTGAFVFDEWIAGDRINMHKNENYWGDEPAYTNLTVRFIADSATRFIELETGGVDACDNISGDNYTRMLNGVDNCVLYDTLSTKTFWISYSDDNEIVSNPLVRKAISHALDLEAIVRSAYGESAVPADSSVAATLPFYESQADRYAYDPELAKQELADAGYPDGIDLELILEEVTELANFAEAAQSYWKEVGINVEIKIYDIPTAGEMSNTGEAYFTIRNGGCASGDPDQCYNSKTAAYGGTTAIGDAAFNEMLEGAKTIADQEERFQAYREIQEYVADNCFETPLLTPVFAYGTRDYVTNFDADPSNVPNLKVVTFQ